MLIYMYKIHYISQTDNKVELSKYLDDKHFFAGKPKAKGCEGSRGQGCCLEEVKCQGLLLGVRRGRGGGAHFVKAGESVGIAWGLVG